MSSDCLPGTCFYTVSGFAFSNSENNSTLLFCVVVVVFNGAGCPDRNV